MASLQSAARYAVAVCFILFLSSCYVDGDVYNPSESDFSADATDWYNMPSHGSFSQEFKFEIAPGRTECFYQPMLNGTQLFLTYEVSKCHCATRLNYLGMFLFTLRNN